VAEGPAPRASRRRTIGVVALWAIVMGGVSFLAGCYGHNCDGDSITWGRNPGEGRLIDADNWESSPIDGDWIPFTRQRVVFFEMRDLGDRIPYQIIPYISAEPNPVHDNGNWTLGSGNLAEHSGAGPGTIAIKNDTCADYFIRIVATVPPRPPPASLAASASPPGALP
jgi:hypothetical protein